MIKLLLLLIIIFICINLSCNYIEGFNISGQIYTTLGNIKVPTNMIQNNTIPSNHSTCSFFLNNILSESAKYGQDNDTCNIYKNQINFCQNNKDICLERYPTEEFLIDKLSIKENCSDCKMDPKNRNLVCNCSNTTLILPLAFCQNKDITYNDGRLETKCIFDDYPKRTSVIDCSDNKIYDEKTNKCICDNNLYKNYNGSCLFYLKSSDNDMNKFLDRIRNAYNSTNSNGILLSSISTSSDFVFGDTNLDSYKMDGSSSIIRKDIYNNIYIGDNQSKFMMGYIWDTNYNSYINIFDCLYPEDEYTDIGENYDRCSRNNKIKSIKELFNFFKKEDDHWYGNDDVFNECVILKDVPVQGIDPKLAFFLLKSRGKPLPSGLFLAYSDNCKKGCVNSRINNFKKIFHSDTFVIILKINLIRKNYTIVSGEIIEIETIKKLGDIINYFNLK